MAQERGVHWRGHGLKFDVRTGCSQVSPDLRNQCYAMHVVDGQVVLDLNAIQ